MFDPDSSSIARLPNPLRMARALWRENSPFVMVNLLAYKAQATGKHAHLSGREAYRIYVRSVEKAQAPLGSKLLWSGEVRTQRSGASRHEFGEAGLMQYASPAKMLEFILRGASDHGARKAGLEGQWLLAATTLEYSSHPGHGTITLMELFGFSDATGEASAEWRKTRDSAHAAVGATRIWRGRVDSHILGHSDPPIHEVMVTAFPSGDALTNALEASGAPVGLRPWWAFEVSTGALLDGLKPD
ncbi:MAG: hypothetical protein AAGA48_38345 [Myxococcota bacterium]